MLAAEAGHYDAVELLLQHHADTDEQNLVHCRPLFAILHYISKLVQSVLCLFVSFFVCFVMYFIVHAAFVHTKLMMMMITMMITLSFNPLFRRAN